MSGSKSRREFLTGAAGAAAAFGAFYDGAKLAAAPLVADPKHEHALARPSNPIKFGVIGVGGRGTHDLGQFLKTQAVDVVGICDTRPEARENAAKMCQGMSPKQYENYQDLLADKSIEAVLIATPVYEHKEMAIAACEAGKHIYLEKPLGLDAKESHAVHAAAVKTGKVFQVGFQWVYNQNARAAVAAVHEGVIGDVCFLRAQRHGSGDLPLGQKGWLMDRNRSGDIIVEQAVHEMNIFCWALKKTPLRAMGLGGISYYVDTPPGRSVMDNYSLTLEFPEHIRVSYSHMFFAPKPLDGMFIYIFGKKGAVDVLGGQIYMADGSAPEPKKFGLSGDDTFNAMVSFVDKVRNGGQADAGADGALAATLTAVLGRTAMYKEKTIHWKAVA